MIEEQKDTRDYMSMLGMYISLAYIGSVIIALTSIICGLYMAFFTKHWTYVIVWSIIFPYDILFGTTKTIDWNFPGFFKWAQKQQ